MSMRESAEESQLSAEEDIQDDSSAEEEMSVEEDDGEEGAEQQHVAEQPLDQATLQDMAILERTMRNLAGRYRLIDKIGEGKPSATSHDPAANASADSGQEPSRPYTRRKICNTGAIGGRHLVEAVERGSKTLGRNAHEADGTSPSRRSTSPAVRRGSRTSWNCSTACASAGRYVRC